MSYMKRYGRFYLVLLLLSASFNLYFICLMRDRNPGFLLYLDLLLLVCLVLFAGADSRRFYRLEKRKRSLLEGEGLVCEALSGYENEDIAAHDVRVLNEKLNRQFEENCELQDYVAKWCHELKLPLSAGLLIAEEIRDVELRGQLREQLERMKQQMNGMLLGCKLQSALFDLQIAKTLLTDCVRTSVRNNQFFLIQKKTALEVGVEESWVYTDPAWLVYILDQLLNNAVKYTGEEPLIRIKSRREERQTVLFVEDNGTGILPEEQRRIFEKGFTGSNYHNGKYKSTGMGLYMAKKIADRLGHELSVESRYGEYTRFEIRFGENDYYTAGRT